MTTKEDQLRYLLTTADDLGTDVRVLTQRVLESPGFTTWTGSLNNRHHYGEGGLLRHTYEVAYLCMNQCDTFARWGAPPIDRRVVWLAAIFHDSGKVYDYKLDAPIDFPSTWAATPHHRQIHHINRSAVLWTRAVAETKLCVDIEDAVLHCILAHHGSPDRGSPVLPQTREAWMLHLMDAQSAWMDGVGKMDPKP